MNKEMLLSLLETNARYDTRDLADILLEDEESVIHTMKDMEKKKIICGYHTIINWDKTNKDKVMAMIEVEVPLKEIMDTIALREIFIVIQKWIRCI